MAGGIPGPARTLKPPYKPFRNVVYGGFVISNAAYGRSDVLGLVYAAGFVPDEGDTIVGLGEGFRPSEAFDHLIFTGEPFASPAFIEFDDASHVGGIIRYAGRFTRLIEQAVKATTH